MIAFLAFHLAAPAHARDIPVLDVDTQLYRLPVDATSTLWADDSHLASGVSGRVAVGYLKEPFVWIWDDTGERVAVVDNVLGLDAIAAFSAWRIRGAVDVPLYPVATGALLPGGGGSGGGLGDIAVDLKGVVLDREDAAVGLALGSRVSFPTSTASVALGAEGVGWEISAIVDKRVGPVVLAANVGHRGVPAVSTGGLPFTETFGDRLVYRAGVGVDASESVGVSFDLAGHIPYAAHAGPSARSLEAMVGGWVRLSDPLVVRGGLGRGLSGGIGSPTLRAVVALAWEPSARREVERPPPRDALEVAGERAPEILVVPGTSTLPPGIVHIRVRNAERSPLVARWAFGTVAEGQITNGLGMARVAPGPWSILVSANGYASQVLSVDVDTGMTTGVEVVLLPTRLSLLADRIELLEKIRWNDFEIDPASKPILDEIAAVLRAHPDIVAVRIEGHTDNRGTAQDNLTLSGLRAAAVMTALVERGLDPGRFAAAGYGHGRPLDNADTPAAWERNQRIELVITSRAP